MIKEIIIYGFLLTFLIVGIGYREKIKKFKDYALGTHICTKLALSATVVATLVGGGSTIGSIAMLYEVGIIFVILSFAWPIGNILIAIYIIPRLEEYYGHFSLPQVMSSMYGRYVREYIGVIAYIFLLGTLAMQVKALSVLFFNILGYKSEAGPIAAFLIIIAYTSIKGVTGVIKTDILQLFIFIIILPLITISLLKENSGTLHGLLLSLPKDSFIKDISVFSIFALAVQTLLPDDGPDFIHRMLIGRDTKKNRTAIYSLVLVSILIIIMVLIISSIALIKFPDIDSNEAMFVVIKSFLNNEILYSIFGVALIAVIVSTADSILNTSSVIIVNDIISEKRKSVFLAKLISLITGITAVIIALKANSILGILLFFGQLYTSAVAVPFFFGLFFNDKSPRIFWCSSLLGIGTYILIYLIAPHIEDGIFLISMSTSAISYLLLSKNKFSNFIHKIKNFIIRESAEKSINLPIKKLGYSILPISLSVVFLDASFSPQQIVEISVVILNLLLISIEIIYAEKMKYKNIIYSFVFWYCFPVFSMYLYFSETNFILFTFLFPMTLILSLVFYKWERILINLLTAYIFAFLLLLTLNRFDSNLLVSKLDLLAYMLFYIAGLSYFIIKPKKEHIKAIMDNIEVRLKERNKEEIENIIGFYSIKLNLFEKYNYANKKYKEIRNIVDYVCKEEQEEEINMHNINEELDAYLSYRLHSMNTEYSLENQAKESDNKIFTNTSYKIIYVLLFSIGNFITTIRPSKVNAMYEKELDNVAFKFKIEGLKCPLEDLEKYSAKSHHNDYLSILEIKGVIEQLAKIELSIEGDLIIFKVKRIEPKKLYQKEIFH